MAKNKNKPDIPDCEERDNETQQKINALKKIYCKNLDVSDNEIENLKVGYESSEKIYRSKERRYLSTRDNSQRYINTEISLGSQLVQANAKLKANMGNYKKWDDDLAIKLGDIFSKVKMIKTKMGELRDAAIKLENSKNDSCSGAQWNIITGKCDCKDDEKPAPALPEPCKDIEKVLEMLFDMPKALLLDIDSVFKSSSDIIGIQKFCNTGSLVVLQEKLSGNADEFDKLLLKTIELRKTDLEARQKELKDALAGRTGAIMDLYNERCNYAGIHSTLKKICCPTCGCVSGEVGDCRPRLDDCAEDICDICGEVKYAFLKDEAPPEPAPAP